MLYEVITLLGYGIVIFRTEQFRRSESGPDLHTLYRPDRHKGLGQCSIKFIKDRFAKTGRTAGGPDFNKTTQGVLV